MDELNEKASVILPEGGDEKCIEEAMAMCPVDCISWEGHHGEANNPDHKFPLHHE